MKNGISSFIFWTLLLANISLASADEFRQEALIFLNLNGGLMEQRAAEEIAKKRGQKIYILPDDPKGEWVKAMEIRARYSRKPMNPSEAWLKSSEESKARVRELSKQYPKSSEMLRRTLETIKSRGEKLDTVIFSAHAGSPELFSEADAAYKLKLPVSETESLQREFPDSFNQVRQALLMGCYTTTENNRLFWHKIFPNASLIAGFDEKAPGRTSESSHTYIRDVTAQADQLDGERSLREMVIDEDLLKSTFGTLKAVNGTHAALDYCNQTYMTYPTPPCKKAWDEFLVQIPIFEKLYLSQTPEEDPPRITDHTYLRSFYSRARKLCSPNFPHGTVHGILSDPTKARELADEFSEKAYRLLFWWSIQKNFGKYFADDLASLQIQLDRAGSTLRVPSFDGNLSWRELHKFYAAASKLARFSPPARKKHIEAALAPIRELTILNPKLIPSNWESEEVIQASWQKLGEPSPIQRVEELKRPESARNQAPWFKLSRWIN